MREADVFDSRENVDAWNTRVRSQESGQMLPSGGDTGDVLKKSSADDYDYAWAAESGGGGGGVDTSGTPVANDFARFTDADTLEGRSASETLSDIGAAPSGHNHDATYAALSHNHAASEINSGTFADARVAESNITQHQAALSITESQISDLQSYLTAITKAQVEAVLTGEISTHTHAGTFDSYPGIFSLSTSHNITTTESTIPFDTEDADPDTNYANSSGEITATNAGWYSLAVNIPVNDDGTSGATRGRVFAFLQRDQASSTWIDVDNIRGQDYHREASGGSGLHLGGLVQLSAGEAIRVRIDVSSSTDVSTETGEASLNIHRIKA